VSAFDYAAAHEFIRHGDNGLVAPVGDETTFFANAVRLVTEPTLRPRLAAAAPAAVSNRSWDAIIDRFAADLNEAIAEHHTTSGRPQSALGNAKVLSPSRP
jgi:glycosyltransferase involved in cell wall biosynthesis